MQNSRCRQEKKDPDFARCRTSSVGAVMPGSGIEMFYCGIDYAECRYALQVGYDYLCKHKSNHAFAKAEGC